MILAVDPVPSDYAQRKKLWVNSSIWLLVNERPYVPLAADDFLSRTAFEPTSPPPFPIGGPLGQDD
jgi:hypothetical protein